jgi:hypothetical protein
VTRPVIYRKLPARWVPVQQAEGNLRDEVHHLRAAADGCLCGDCRASLSDRKQAAAMLSACADELRSLWLPHEEELTGADLLFAEMTAAMCFGGTQVDDVLPEAGVRVCGPSVAISMRFADSTSPDEPELLLIEDLLVP